MLNGKKKRIFAALGLVLTMALTVTLVPTQAQAAPYSKICSDTEWTALHDTNVIRRGLGLKPLAISKKLQSVAEKRAKELVQSYSHTLPGTANDSFEVYYKSSKLKYDSCAENIQEGTNVSAKQAVVNWKNSTIHYTNMTNSKYGLIGIGYYQSGGMDYWTQVFMGDTSYKVNSISISDGSKTVSYKKGTSIDAMKRCVTIKSSQGTLYMPLLAKNCSGYKKNTLGTQKITVKYNGKKATFKVKITN